MNTLMVASLCGFYSKKRVKEWAKAHNHILSDIIGNDEVEDFIRYNDCVSQKKNDLENPHMRIIGR